jgi:hypothetical protein
MKYLITIFVLICAVVPTYYYIKLRGWRKKVVNNTQESKWLRFGKIRNIVVITILIAGWFGWDSYQSKNWIATTYPADGATNVPRDVTIVAMWKGARGNNLGMPIRYVDAPNEHIPGVTGGSESGMSFKPNGEFVPAKKVIVTVEAGSRRHTFTFTIAEKST